jgi:hypothetical protein
VAEAAKALVAGRLSSTAAVERHSVNFAAVVFVAAHSSS